MFKENTETKLFNSAKNDKRKENEKILELDNQANKMNNLEILVNVCRADTEMLKKTFSYDKVLMLDNT